jgi:hypothetical protein
MNDLIDRYVHQVGVYVRPKERADIEAELRSQIQDQLDDRYGDAPTQSDIAAMLRQLGDPRTMAASYGGEQYLVGPDLYPFLLTVLRFGLPLVPAVVVIANFVSALLSPEGSDWITLIVGSLFTALQMVLLFFAVVVIVFAILQHAGEEVRAATTGEFNPLELPAVDDPRAVDRAESGVGIALGTLFGIALLYYLQVGGLTLRFNLSDPGDVLPAPTSWIIVLLVVNVSLVLLNLWALLRRRWTFGMWLAQAAVEVVGALALYFAIYLPVLARLAQSSPELAASLRDLPSLITLITVVIQVLGNGSRLIRLWQYRKEVTA